MNIPAPKEGDVRITVHTICAGQPRTYADSVYTTRMYVEWFSYKKEWIPCQFREELIHQYAKGFNSWKFTRDSKDREWHESYLDYFKQIEPGVWEWSVISPFTD